MKHKLLIVAVVAVVMGSAGYLAAHCEVPCGIYDDHGRFDSMLEDQATIAKAIAQIEEIAGKSDAQSHNQLARWVTTKEAHATAMQHVVAQYFMTQRIKPTAKNYVEQLTAAHGVMIAAMKCKQSADPATAVALEKAIKLFQSAYESK